MSLLLLSLQSCWPVILLSPPRAGIGVVGVGCPLLILPLPQTGQPRGGGGQVAATSTPDLGVRHPDPRSDPRPGRHAAQVCTQHSPCTQPAEHTRPHRATVSSQLSGAGPTHLYFIAFPSHSGNRTHLSVSPGGAQLTSMEASQLPALHSDRHGRQERWPQ